MGKYKEKIYSDVVNSLEKNFCYIVMPIEITQCDFGGFILEKVYRVVFDVNPLCIKDSTEVFENRTFKLLIGFNKCDLKTSSPLIPYVFDENGALNKNNPRWSHYFGYHGLLCLGIKKDINSWLSTLVIENLTKGEFVTFYLTKFLIPYLWNYCYFTKYNKMFKPDYENHKYGIQLKDNFFISKN